jgi:hypothetical protein
VDACAQKCLEYTGGCRSFTYHSDAATTQLACYVYDVAYSSLTCEDNTAKWTFNFQRIDHSPASTASPAEGSCTHLPSGDQDQLAYAHCKAATLPLDCLGPKDGTATHGKAC